MRMRAAFFLLALFSFAIVLSCAKSNSAWIELTPEPSISSPAFHLVGAVQFVHVEGGVFVIRDAEGTQYTPINLPDSFKVDKMAVEAEARRRDDLTSTTMVGSLVELLRIRARPDA